MAACQTVNFIKSNSKNERSLDLSLWFFVTGISVVFLFDVQVGLGIPVVRFMNLKTIGYGFLFFSLLFALCEGKIRKLRPGYRTWLLFVFASVCFMAVLGFINRNPFVSLYFTSCDVFAITCFSGMLVAGKQENWKVIEKTLLSHFAMGMALCVFYALTYGGALLYREVVASPLYDFWGLLYGWPYFLLTVKKGSVLRKGVSIIGLSVFCLLSIIFLKRSPFVQGALLVGSSFILNRLAVDRKVIRSVHRRRVLSGVGVALFATLVILAGFKLIGLDKITEEHGAGYGVSGLINRFMQQGSLLQTAIMNYRISHEGKTVLETSSDFDLVFGRGLGATIPVSMVHSSEGLSGELHNGMAKIVLKGGLVFLAIWYFGWLLLVKDSIKYARKPLVPFYSIIIMSVAMSIFAPFFNNSLSFLLVMVCSGRCMARLS